MFQKVVQWMFGEKQTSQSNSRFLNLVVEEKNDPRELPRPDPVKNLITSPKSKGQSKTECDCNNCYQIFDKFSECLVCTNPLQCTAICSCMFCGNYICWTCSEKVQNCPFCRISFASCGNRVRNYALERLLSRFDLPCKYASRGCRVSLQCADRFSHEELCEYGLSNCPLLGICGWEGKPSDITHHLRSTHNVTIHTTNQIDLEIRNFFTKLLNHSLNKPRPYTITMRYLGNIFVCRLTMRQLALRLLFLQIPSDSAIINQKFEAYVEITNNTRTLTGTVKIFSSNRQNKEVIIPGKTIMHSEKNIDHLVKISITIKPTST